MEAPPETPPAEAGSARLEAVAGVASTVAKVSGSALWTAGSWAANYVGSKVATPSATANGQGTDDGTLRGLGSAEILKMANTLDGIFSSGDLSGAAGKLKPPEVPRLVVVGTQSSGKSSLLNGIMGADMCVPTLPPTPRRTHALARLR